MGLLRSFAKVGIAKKVFDVARRPENQAKMRQAFDRVTNRGSQGGGRKASKGR